MKTLFFLVSFFCLSWAYSQAPEGLNYQAVARDGNGTLLQNQSVDVQFSIRSGSANGSVVYAENHTLSTNDYGLFTAIIGEGTPSQGTFAAIDWGTNSHYLQVEVDAGSGMVDMGTTQLMSVPYALYAKSAGNAANYTAGTGISINGNTISNTGDTNPNDDINTGTAAGGDLSGTFPSPSVIAIQGRSISTNVPANGQVLKWNGSAWAPGNDNSGGGSFNPGTGISISGSTISAQNSQAIWNANELQGRSISTNVPANGQVLKWNGNAWAPATDATGGGNSIWTQNGNHINYTTGNVGIGTTNPGRPLHVNGRGRFSDGGEFFDIETNGTGQLGFYPNGAINAAMTIDDDADYVGLYRNTPLTSSSHFDINSDAAANTYGGMYINTNSTQAKPFYGYATGGLSRAWTYYDGATNQLRLNNNGDHLVIANNGNIGMGTSNPTKTLDIAGNLLVTNGQASVAANQDNSLQYFEITRNNISVNSDLVALQVQSGAPDNAQFIEFQRGSTIEAAINTDGSAEFQKVELKETTSTPTKNTAYANALPLAYASISSFGSVLTDYGIASVNRPNTGEYVITLDHSWVGDPVVLVTTLNNSTSVENATYSLSGSNTITVRISNSSNSATNSNFSIMVMGTAQ